MKAFLLLGSLLVFLNAVKGNTEIVNFQAQEVLAVDLDFTDAWPELNATSSSLQLNVTSARLGSMLPRAICGTLDQWQLGNPQTCPHEVWLSLSVDDEGWKHFDKFTLRLSWPAFHPTQITMDIYDPTSLGAFTTKGTSSNTTTMTKTRRRYARIQMVHTGVLTPGIVLDDNSRYNVPFILTLEPLYFGVLPESVLPVVCAILCVILLGLPIAAKINGGLQTVVLEAKRDFIGIRPPKID
ncbi:hypothetical protein M413DRAFT_347306 [Hebeloma cylindrosporum]|uniref:Uncharacterized protein n=1 Tax=Hebeloma cylindrosporum TaxID=76867 RepID=A0A0C2Y3J2_HEBCY|nr:hypothetical protein M413DRAFT_347306 [Hebeloma cylindrosporum h7]